ncbi:MAG: hypothetical protein R3F49_02525 [Planctomycetota bacterium]
MQVQAPLHRSASLHSVALRIATLGIAALGLALLALLAGCSGGGTAQTTPGATAPSVLGDWTLAATTTASAGSCNAMVGDVEALGAEFDTTGGALVLRLVLANGIEHEFAVQQTGRQLVLSGASVAGLETLELLPGSQLTLLAGLPPRLVGTFEWKRDDPTGSCVRTLDIDGVRAPTPSSLTGDWEVASTTTAAAGACSGTLGAVQFYDLAFATLGAARYEATLVTGGGDVLLLEAQVSGDRVIMSGVSAFGADTLTLLPGSELTLQEGNTALAGTLEVSILGAGGACDATWEIAGVRAPERGYLPFLRDTGGESRFVGIDATDPAATTDLMAGLTDAVDPLPILNGDAHVAVVVERSKFERATGVVSGHRDSTLYYSDGGAVFALDIGVRRDRFGRRTTPQPTLLFAGNGSPISDLTAYGEFNGLGAVLHFRRPNEGVVMEVTRDFATSFTTVAATAEVVGAITDPLDRRFAGLVLRVPSSGELLTASASGTTSLANSATSVLLAESGAIGYVRNGTSLRTIDRTTQAEVVVDEEVGGVYALGASDGGDLYYVAKRASDPGRIQLKRLTAGGQVDLVAEDTNAVAANTLFDVAVRVTDNYVVVQYRTSLNAVRVFSTLKAGGPLTDITPPAPYNLRDGFTGALGDRLLVSLFDSGLGRFVARSHSAAAPDGAFDLGRFWSAALPSDAYTLGQRRPLAGVVATFLGGEMVILDASADPLAPVTRSIAPPTTASSRVLFPHGTKLMLAEQRLDGFGTPMSTGVAFTDTSLTSAAVVITSPAASFDVPVPSSRTARPIQP